MLPAETVKERKIRSDMDKGIKFKFLMENKTDNPGILAEHGLSIYIEACGKRILFDAGATDIFVKNAEMMNVDLSDVDFAVVSHGHYDHTGGFPSFCEINEKADIYIHKNAFRESYVLKDGRLYGPDDGIRWNRSQYDFMKKRLVFTDGPVRISDDICVTGTIKREDGFQPTEKFYYRDGEGNITEDDMSHEQCLIIRQPEGLYIFSGCSHTGVISAINTSKALFPGERMALLVAGMHLYSASLQIRTDVIDRIEAEQPECVMPVHCTGIEAICDLKSRLGERCIIATAGDSYNRNGDTNG